MHRRALLSASATATSALLAGCAILERTDADGTEDGDDGRDGGPWPIGRWLVAGDDAPRPGHTAIASSISPAYYRDHSDALPASARPVTIVEGTIPSTIPIELTAVDRIVSAGGLRSPAGSASYDVTTGSFTRDEIVTTVLEGGGRRIGTDGEFALLDDGEEHDLAVADGSLVTTQYHDSGGSFPETVAPVLHTARGDRDGLLERRSTPAEIAGRLRMGLGWRLRLFDPDPSDTTRSAPLPGAAAAGKSTSVDGDRARSKNVLAFPDASDVEESAVEQYAASFEEHGFDRIEHTVDGRIVEIELSGDVSAVVG